MRDDSSLIGPKCYGKMPACGCVLDCPSKHSCFFETREKEAYQRSAMAFSEAMSISKEKDGGIENESSAVASERPSKDEYYLNIAREVSTRSTCLKRHYGCIIVNNDRIVSTGYNGSPRGAENCCDRGTCKRMGEARYSGYEACDSVHAEQNALISASAEELRGAVVYLACMSRNWSECNQCWFDWGEDNNPIPCPLCNRMLRNSGIVRVVNRMGDIDLWG